MAPKNNKKKKKRASMQADTNGASASSSSMRVSSEKVEVVEWAPGLPADGGASIKEDKMKEEDESSELRKGIGDEAQQGLEEIRDIGEQMRVRNTLVAAEAERLMFEAEAARQSMRERDEEVLRVSETMDTLESTLQARDEDLQAAKEEGLALRKEAMELREELAAYAKQASENAATITSLQAEVAIAVGAREEAEVTAARLKGVAEGLAQQGKMLQSQLAAMAEEKREHHEATNGEKEKIENNGSAEGDAGAEGDEAMASSSSSSSSASSANLTGALEEHKKRIALLMAENLALKTELTSTTDASTRETQEEEEKEEEKEKEVEKGQTSSALEVEAANRTILELRNAEISALDQLEEKKKELETATLDIERLRTQIDMHNAGSAAEAETTSRLLRESETRLATALKENNMLVSQGNSLQAEVDMLRRAPANQAMVENGSISLEVALRRLQKAEATLTRERDVTSTVMNDLSKERERASFQQTLAAGCEEASKKALDEIENLKGELRKAAEREEDLKESTGRLQEQYAMQAELVDLARNEKEAFDYEVAKSRENVRLAEAATEQVQTLLKEERLAKATMVRTVDNVLAENVVMMDTINTLRDRITELEEGRHAIPITSERQSPEMEEEEDEEGEEGEEEEEEEEGEEPKQQPSLQGGSFPSSNQPPPQVQEMVYGSSEAERKEEAAQPDDPPSPSGSESSGSLVEEISARVNGGNEEEISAEAKRAVKKKSFWEVGLFGWIAGSDRVGVY